MKNIITGDASQMSVGSDTLPSTNLVAQISKVDKQMVNEDKFELIKKMSGENFSDDEALRLMRLCEIDHKRSYPSPRYLLNQNKIGTAPLANLQAIKAKAKQGKSFVCSILLASILGCKDFGLNASTHANDLDRCVIYFDTEQEVSDTARILGRVKVLCGDDVTQRRFKCFSIEELSPAQRTQFVEMVIKTHKPLAVVIDGVADLITDFNNIQESDSIISTLKRLSVTYDCAVINVLHIARTAQDGGMKGHLGSLLLQKCSDVYEVKKKDNGIFDVSVSDCRHEPINDFSFTIDHNGIPRNADTLRKAMEIEKAEQRVTEKRNELKELVDGIKGIKSGMSYQDLSDGFMTLKGCTDRTARRMIKECLELGVLVKIDNIIKLP